MDLDSILTAVEADGGGKFCGLPRGPAFFDAMDSPKARAEAFSAVGNMGKKLSVEGKLTIPVPAEAHQNCNVEARQWRHPLSQDRSYNGRGRYAGKLTLHEAVGVTQNILIDMDILRIGLAMQLETHGDLILSRWTKKSRDKRATILSEASPTIFGSWPRKKGHSEEQDGDCCSRAKAREIWRRDHYVSWHQARWLNIGDFMDDRNKLLSVLYVRTAYSPNDWAMFDTRESEIAWSTGIRPVWFNEHCVNFCGCGCGYGSLSDYRIDLTHRWAHVGFPRALQTLEIQRDILVMLDEVVSKIIDGSKGTGSSKWEALVNRGFGASGHETLWNTYTEQAFAPPVNFDPEALLQRSKEQLDMILDEVWLMQTEPAYMQRVIKLRRDAPSFDNSVQPEKKLTAVVTELVAELCERLTLWKLVVAQLEEVARAYPPNAKPEDVASNIARESMTKLTQLLKACLAAAHSNLEAHLPAMQSMRGRFKAAQVGGDVVYHERKTSLDPKNDCDRLMWCMDELKVVLESRDETTGMRGFMASIEREILAQSPAQFVDRQLYQQLADIQSLDELLLALQWSQLAAYSDMINGQYVTPESRAMQILDSALASTTKRKLRVGTTSKTRLYGATRALLDTPWPKGRLGLAWLEKAKACRQQLQQFWIIVRNEITKQDGGGEWSKRIVKSMMFDSDDQFLEEVEREEQACLLAEGEARAAAAAKSEAASQKHQSVTQTTWGNSTDETLPTGRKQTKAKAARTAASESAKLSQNLQDLRIDTDSKADRFKKPPIPQIKVKKESLSIFRKMYPAHQDDLELRSNTRWQVFLQAMTDAGFLATEASGSAVRFSNDQGSISFHKPHPDPVIDPVMLHSMARRMKKRFGWGGETFVLRASTTGLE
ncbi:hypothetical protein AC578_4253 [Pseudocercospora eumusae]|uniref:Uncharacterized protein n=1 Tax=Pseudocercospora eumusae TaxID=321146 RepID=A0A139HAN1_9PEZI|nr:hypothetical protein AC578_4253 [Pseudocercospora eumusae]